LIVYLIEADERVILVDAGCDTMPGFTLKHFASPVEILRRAGYEPKDVTDLILTHAHHDHAEAAKYYPQARIYVHESERHTAEPYLGKLPHVHTFQKGIHIADGVEFCHVGGHSPGSSIVLIRAKGDTLVLCGDECYTHDNLTLGIPTASSFCPERSRAFVEEYRKSGYRPVIFHDPSLVGKIGASVLLEHGKLAF
jgi:glyoxylase-like metal-dependent hydrolase (beta-lactamase superfamily II)